jgi:hypothetical protein
MSRHLYSFANIVLFVQEARKNSRVAAAVFASHRMSLELDATTKAENARLLDPTASLLLTPDPDELALEFEQHLHTQISTMSPSEAFSIRERSTGRRSRADSATLLADLRRESNDSVLSHMNRPTGVELNEAISELENVGCCARFWTFVESMSRRALFLVILGLLSGLVAVLINVCIRWLIEAGLHIATNSKAAFVAYVLYVSSVVHSVFVFFSDLLYYFLFLQLYHLFGWFITGHYSFLVAPRRRFRYSRNEVHLVRRPHAAVPWYSSTFENQLICQMHFRVDFNALCIDSDSDHQNHWFDFGSGRQFDSRTGRSVRAYCQRHRSYYDAFALLLGAGCF